MKRLVGLALVLGVAACGNTGRADDAAMRAAASVNAPPPPGTAAPANGPPAGNTASAPNNRAPLTSNGVAVQQPVSPMMHQAPTGTDRESISTHRGTVGTTGAF